VEPRDVRIVGVPLDYGADRRGVDMGPSAIRYAGLAERLRRLGHQVTDLGNVPVPVPESRTPASPRLKYLAEIVKVNRVLARTVERILLDGALPLVLGGDHSLAVGSLAGLTRVHARAGVLWFDAHGDFNTPDTTPSGNVHGMPAAVAVGLGHPELTRLFRDRFIDPRKLAYIGVRTLDPGEKDLMRQHGVGVFSMTEVDKYGMREVVARALDLVSTGTDAVHVSFDIDAIDPLFAPGSGTPYTGGLTVREAHLALEMIAEAGVMSSLDMVEVNPILDERNRTAILACELIASALGKRIF
jgi:arginase